MFSIYVRLGIFYVLFGVYRMSYATLHASNPEHTFQTLAHSRDNRCSDGTQPQQGTHNDTVEVEQVPEAHLTNLPWALHTKFPHGYCAAFHKSREDLAMITPAKYGKIGAKVASHGRTCLAVVGNGDRASDQAQRSLFELRKIGINCAVFTAHGAYPTAEGVDEARAMARRVGAMSIVGIGVGGALDTAKAAAKLHSTSDKCKGFLKSPGSVMMGEGTHSEPKVPIGDALPLVMIPSSAGAGAWANDRCLIWHPEDEVLVPMTTALGQRSSSSVALVDAELCRHLSTEQTVVMALTALSACIDAIIASELDIARSSLPDGRSKLLLELGTRGIGQVGMGLPRVLEQGKDMEAREMLTAASLYAGQLCDITPAPATQLLARAAGSLLCRHDYSSVCAAVFPHVVRDMIEQADSFSSDAEVSAAVNRALSRAATALLGNDKDAQALVSWLETLQQQKKLRYASLSDLDSMVTAQEVATNVEMLLAIEDDTDAADRVFSWSSALSVAKRAIG